MTGGSDSGSGMAKYVTVSRVGTTGELDLGAREQAAGPGARRDDARAGGDLVAVASRSRTEPGEGSISVTRRWSRTTAPASTAPARRAAYARSASVVPPSGWKSTGSSRSAAIGQRSTTCAPVRSSWATPHAARARAFSTRDRAEVEAARLHDQLLAGLRLELPPALERALRQADVVRVGVGEAEDPRGAVARAALVPEAELLDEDRRPAPPGRGRARSRRR